jgi:hypothetical protein
MIVPILKFDLLPITLPFSNVGQASLQRSWTKIEILCANFILSPQNPLNIDLFVCLILVQVKLTRGTMKSIP